VGEVGSPGLPPALGVTGLMVGPPSLTFGDSGALPPQPMALRSKSGTMNAATRRRTIANPSHLATKKHRPLGYGFTESPARSDPPDVTMICWLGSRGILFVVTSCRDRYGLLDHIVRVQGGGRLVLNPRRLRRIAASTPQGRGEHDSDQQATCHVSPS